MGVIWVYILNAVWVVTTCGVYYRPTNELPRAAFR